MWGLATSSKRQRKRQLTTGNWLLMKLKPLNITRDVEQTTERDTAVVAVTPTTKIRNTCLTKCVKSMLCSLCNQARSPGLGGRPNEPDNALFSIHTKYRGTESWKKIKSRSFWVFIWKDRLSSATSERSWKRQETPNPQPHVLYTNTKLRFTNQLWLEH